MSNQLFWCPVQINPVCEGVMRSLSTLSLLFITTYVIELEIELRTLVLLAFLFYSHIPTSIWYYCCIDFHPTHIWIPFLCQMQKI